MADQVEERKRKRGRRVVSGEEAARREAERFREATRPVDAQGALFELGAADGPLPDDDKPSGPGRPVGARAITPQNFRRYILATKGDFIGRFAGLANVDTFAFAKILNCTPLEALRLQLDLGKAAAPYIYQQQPRPELEGLPDYFAGLVFMAGKQAADAAGDEGEQPFHKTLAALAGRPPTIEEIQVLGPVEFAASEPAHSEPSSEDEEKAP